MMKILKRFTELLCDKFGHKGPVIGYAHDPISSLRYWNHRCKRFQCGTIFYSEKDLIPIVVDSVFVDPKDSPVQNAKDRSSRPADSLLFP
jgi:hypothetical protein